ncbi:MAG: Uma2 family endonuclease [Myxococcota bacterium]|nr:Uma2 family endonuclease [Myxococcota bacterium]
MRAYHHRYTLADYLSIESASNTKHEFFQGEVFAMGGGPPEHAALSAAIMVSLGAQLQGKPCRVYTSDLRVRVQSTSLLTYPDVTVVCGKPQLDPEDRLAVVNPTVLVEVLSDSSEAYDRTEKFESYRQLPSLREYVLVSHREPLLEVHHQGEDGAWTSSQIRAPERIRLSSLDCELDVAAIYRGIELQR